MYVIANGYCVFNGKPIQLIPFLDIAGYSCPPTYTPADFGTLFHILHTYLSTTFNIAVIELVHSNPQIVQNLATNSQNGKINAIQDKKHLAEPEDFEVYQETTQQGMNLQDMDFATTFIQQFTILIRRMFLQMSRNKTMLYIQFFHHLLSGLLLGGIYFGTGNDATQTIAIFKYCISINVFFMYTHVMAPVLLCK